MKGLIIYFEIKRIIFFADPFFTQGNSFHGTGGRGTKLAQMRFCLRVLNPIVSLGDDTVNLDLCDQGAIHQLLGNIYLKLTLFH